MASFLDQTGLNTLWNKCKNFFLLLSGGTMTGTIKSTTPNAFSFIYNTDTDKTSWILRKDEQNFWILQGNSSGVAWNGVENYDCFRIAAGTGRTYIKYLNVNQDLSVTTTATIGSTCTASGFYESSDATLKENVGEIEEKDIEKVKQVDFKHFNFIDDKDKIKKYGVIAQEIEKAGLENLVNENEINKKKTVDYTSLLILKIKQLENEIEILKNKLDAKNN